jgi:hypothetical protein
MCSLSFTDFTMSGWSDYPSNYLCFPTRPQWNTLRCIHVRSYRFDRLFICLISSDPRVSSSLIASGICSAIQMTRFKIPFTKATYFGTGLLTVTGTSFATLSTASAMWVER